MSTFSRCVANAAFSEHSFENKNIPVANFSQNIDVFVWVDTRWVQKLGGGLSFQPSW